MAGFSDTIENAVLNLVLSGTSYTPTAGTHLSLHSADPGESGSNEVTGGSYARQSTTWASASGGAKAISSSKDFTGMPSGNVTHWGVWTASTSGTFLVGGTCTNRTLTAGDTYTLSSASVSLD